jgi:hypothetical protein
MRHRVAWRILPFSDGHRSLRAGSRERRAETSALTEACTEIFFPDLELIASYPDYIGSARVGQVTLPDVVGCGNNWGKRCFHGPTASGIIIQPRVFADER